MVMRQVQALIFLFLHIPNNKWIVMMENNFCF